MPPGKVHEGPCLSAISLGLEIRMTSFKAAQVLLVGTHVAAVTCENFHRGLHLQCSTCNAGQGGSKLTLASKP